MSPGPRLRRFRLPAVPEHPNRILVLDDDKEVARTLARTLERMPGVEVVVATTPEETLDMATEEAFDVALVDLGEHARGVDVLVALREAAPTTARVLLSAWPDESVAVGGAMVAGAQAYVLKPWDHGHLVRTIEGLLLPRRLRIAMGPLLN